MKMTRRALAGWAALSVAGRAAPQAPPASAPSGSASPASREFQDAARQLALVKLARTVEPVTRFEA